MPYVFLPTGQKNFGTYFKNIGNFFEKIGILFLLHRLWCDAGRILMCSFSICS